MKTLNIEIEDSILELKKLDKRDEVKKKETILYLAGLLERAIKEKEPRTLNRLKINNLPEDPSSVARLLIWIRDTNQLTFRRSWIYKNLPKKLKTEMGRQVTGESQIVRLSDNYLKEHADELVERIKDVTRGPAQAPKIKVKKDTIDLQGWKRKVSKALVELAKKIDEDENFPEELDDELEKKILMVKDSRFATTWARYEAIVAAVNTTKSLTHAIEEEKRPLTRDEIIKNEGNCRECFCSGEPKSKCNCHCHRTVQQMTTKGLKWAIRHNKRLGEFNEYYKRIGNMDHDDICPSMKSLFTNPNFDKHLSNDDKMNLFTRHIEREQCIRCEMFLNEHPSFFKNER